MYYPNPKIKWFKSVLQWHIVMTTVYKYYKDGKFYIYLPIISAVIKSKYSTAAITSLFITFLFLSISLLLVQLSQGCTFNPELLPTLEDSIRESSSSVTTSVFTATPLDGDLAQYPDVSPDTTTFRWLNLGGSSSTRSMEKSIGVVSLRSRSSRSLLKADRTLLKRFAADILNNDESKLYPLSLCP